MTLDIGVVTSVWGDYGRFLPGWVASVDAQRRRPSMVTVLNAGADIGPALDALSATTLRWQIVSQRCDGMGQARNRAVQATPTEWVMHLDADDLLLPHALDDVAELGERADVVSIGAIRGRRVECFPDVTAAGILRRQHGAFSCAAFRRWLWEQRPYIESNEWIDSVLWVGFAHLGAEFVGTSRPGFIYRRHPGSRSSTQTRQQRRYAVDQWRRLCRRWED